MAQTKKNDLAPYLFHQGTNYEAYKYLGAHSVSGRGGKKTVFRVWAPNAERVFVTGDFCSWDESYEMRRVTERGVWEAVVPVVIDNEARVKYKYKIIKNGREIYKADPYGVFAGTLAETASYLHELKRFRWTDGDWLSWRKRSVTPSPDGCAYSTPVNIYEVHLGSWKRHEDGSYLTYSQLACELAPYVKQMGYTHIELMPVAEHPFDGSWGYQLTGYFAPTSRFGAPEDFMAFVNTMHEYNIGVILDWVPAHFPKDAQGLYEFDGVPLYEYQGRDRMEHRVWGTRFFDVGREEVQSFLVSNALYWLNEYHIDGLRIDAVASMLYLDYDREPGEWIPAYDGSNKNYDAIAFFKKLNCEVFGRFSDVLMIAEESTAWPMITKPVYSGGLGFNFKWNMGWMNDMMSYIEKDPIYRKYHHSSLSFSLMYSFAENYILPVSHDEVVHGKKSLIDKMSGDYGQKFAGMRVFLAYMMTHPGKKLLFMGSEYGQFREWDYESSLEWFMLEYPAHARLREYTAELNHFYLQNRPLWEIDLSWDGFKWIRPDDADENVSAYMRLDTDGNYLVCVMNFSAVLRDTFTLGVPDAGLYREVFTSDAERFGGGGCENAPITAQKGECDNMPYRLTFRLPALSAVIFKSENFDIK